MIQMIRSGSERKDAVRAARELLSLSWQADRSRTMLVIVLGLINALNQASSALWLKFIADGITRHDRALALTGGTLMAAWAAIFGLGTLWSSMVRGRVLHTAIQLAEERLMTMSLDLPGIEHMERPDYLDRIQVLRTQLTSAVATSWTLFDGAMIAVQLAFTASLLAIVHPSLLLLAVFAVPMVVTTLRSHSRLLRIAESQAESQRGESYLFELSTQAAAAKELRVFGLESEIGRRRRRLYDKISKTRLRAEAALQVRQALGLLLFAAAYLAAIAFTALRTLKGAASAGDVIMVLSAGGRLSGQMSGVVTTGASALNVLTGVRHYLWLLDYGRERMAELAEPVAAPVRLSDGIRLRNVGFTYPGTDAKVLHDVTVDLQAGAVIALVGENGAGKTTLVKLLCRFYEATEGSIEIDDVDLRRIPADAWRERMTAGFQDFARFEFQLGHAVGVGDLPRIDSLDVIESAVDRAGATDVVEKLDGGLDAQLGRTFGGAELSGGQWQKVALSRAMMREAPLLFILDEPTAALDPAAEHHLFERYTEGARRLGAQTGAVTLFVSHRFSTVRMADLILVMDQGTIVERGSHHELLALGGLYAELYETQAKAYR